MIHAPSDLEFVLRVLLATACGAAIGLERQYRSRTAGLRTQALVAAGAAAFVLFGEQTGVAPAPVRITAYVVSGVGFLGGGGRRPTRYYPQSWPTSRRRAERNISRMSFAFDGCQCSQLHEHEDAER
ncbi:MAG TPA: MgtC/SapB family protein [Mycobacterium sp.]|jgi:hypothetical protein|nr:MgtC/SapB family protein [Mycobacterium sp.]